MNEQDQLSEAIERAALQSLHTHCPPAAREALGLRLVEAGDVLAAMSAEDGSVLINRALGLGTLTKPTAETVARVAQAYAEVGRDRFFFHVYPELVDPSWLGEAGLGKVRGWRKFYRGMEAPPERSTDLRLERIGPAQGGDFGRIVQTAFGMTPPAAAMLGGLAQDPDWHLFMTYDGDTPAGAGGLYVQGEVGFLEWGATHPDFRRRGSQGAVMSARIQRAIDLGCRYLFTETGESVAGDPQHSYSNILRFGFEEGPLRENWAPMR
ncbi:MAG: GNAT family N-acetyltransferase [Proteobacteria bacterium]|nr:GNAT family N-acetyltransferase [Pseudomonadota bacterium]